MLGRLDARILENDNYTRMRLTSSMALFIDAPRCGIETGTQTRIYCAKVRREVGTQIVPIRQGSEVV